jgi:hypothetical protein
MAQVKLLKIGSDGVATEFAEATDEITLASFTVQGGGPVLGATGLDMNGQNITDVPEVHSAADLKLIADSGGVELQASNEQFSFLDSGGNPALSVDVSAGALVEAITGDLELVSAGYIKLRTSNDEVLFLDASSVQQGTISPFASKFKIQSDVGDLELESATSLIKFLDAASVEQGSFDLSAGSLTIKSGLNDIKLEAASGIVDASAMTFNVDNIDFDDPATSTINQTIGALIIDNIMATDRNNTMASTSSVYFGSITDTAGEVDSFKLPHLAGAPTASPALDASGGWMVYDSTNKNLYIWDGTAWDNQSTVSTANALDLTFVAGENLAAGDAVYIDAAGQAFKADNDSGGASEAIGFARSTVLAAASVDVRIAGRAGGLSGLTVGARYYIGESGGITSTVPSASGEYIVQMGYAVSATEVVVQVLQLGRRA